MIIAARFFLLLILTSQRSFQFFGVPAGPDFVISVEAEGYQTREILIEAEAGLLGWAYLNLKKTSGSSSGLSAMPGREPWDEAKRH
ncbi:MAG: hypothetical protein ACRD1R_09855 [Acidobacteriota bacterium]